MSQVVNLLNTCPKGLVLAGSNATSCPIDALQLLREALRHVAAAGVGVEDVSAYYQTACVPAGLGPDFVNVAFSVVTDIAPVELLHLLHRVEDKFGRERPSRWAPRTLDLDLIGFDGMVVPDETQVRYWMDLSPELQKQDAPKDLILPHPRMHERAFALIPLLDIAPDWRHPILGKTVRELVAVLPDREKKDVRLMKA